MVEKLAEDYSKYFHHSNIEKEINPLCLSIEEMLARLDEFETLLTNIKIETDSIMDNNMAHIFGFQEDFNSLCQRIDKLEKFVEVVNENVNAVERSVDVAEEELGVTDYSLKGLLFKPLFGRVKQAEAERRTNLKDGEFQEVPVFSTSQYFPSENNTQSNVL